MSNVSSSHRPFSAPQGLRGHTVPAHSLYTAGSPSMYTRAPPAVFLSTPGEGVSRRCAPASSIPLASPRSLEAHSRTAQYSSPYLLKHMVGDEPTRPATAASPGREGLKVKAADQEASAQTYASLRQADRQPFRGPAYRSAESAAIAMQASATPRTIGRDRRMRDAAAFYKSAADDLQRLSLGEAPAAQSDVPTSRQRAHQAARSDIFGLSMASRGHWSIGPQRKL
jgi:hypothetical protein